MARRRTRERIEAIERQLEELSHQLERQSDGISNQLELIKTMFTIKDPSAGSSADAYEGLRRTVVLARENRMARLVDLARIDSAASSRLMPSMKAFSKLIELPKAIADMIDSLCAASTPSTSKVGSASA